MPSTYIAIYINIDIPYIGGKSPSLSLHRLPGVSTHIYSSLRWQPPPHLPRFYMLRQPFHSCESPERWSWVGAAEKPRRLNGGKEIYNLCDFIYFLEISPKNSWIWTQIWCLSLLLVKTWNPNSTLNLHPVVPFHFSFMIYQGQTTLNPTSKTKCRAF